MAYQPYAPYPGPSGPPAVDPYAPQPYAYVDPYAGAPPYGAGPGGYGADDIRTVFITGFPDDIKERELTNMCRFLPDFEAASLKYKGPIAQGFALFRNGAGAQHALGQLNHLPYCEGHSLRCEMARKNMYIKSDEYGTAPKMPRTYGPGPSGLAGGGYGSGGGFDTGAVNPPRDTLFIGNLGSDVSDADLEAFFSKLEGFKQLKAVRKDRGTTCFVQFVDIASATAAHDSQQGAEIPTNDRGPLRIQYSKNSLGEKRKREDGYGGYGGYGGGGGGYGGGAPGYQAPPPEQPAARLPRTRRPRGHWLWAAAVLCEARRRCIGGPHPRPLMSRLHRTMHARHHSPRHGCGNLEATRIRPHVVLHQHTRRTSMCSDASTTSHVSASRHVHAESHDACHVSVGKALLAQSLHARSRKGMTARGRAYDAPPLLFAPTSMQANDLGVGPVPRHPHRHRHRITRSKSISSAHLRVHEYAPCGAGIRARHRECFHFGTAFSPSCACICMVVCLCNAGMECVMRRPYVDAAAGASKVLLNTELSDGNAPVGNHALS